MGAVAEAARRAASVLGVHDGRASSDPGIPAGDAAWRARRPSLPPLLFVASGMWGALAAASDVLFGASPAAVLAMLLAGVVLAAASAIGFWRGHGLAACLVLGIALGCILGAAHASALEAQRVALVSSGGMQELEVARDSRETGRGSSVLARAASGAKVRVFLPAGSTLLVGQRIRVAASWREPSGDTARASWRDGVAATASAGSYDPVEPAGPLAPLRAARGAAIAAIESGRAVLEGLSGASFEEPALFFQAVLLGHADGLYGSGFYQAVKACGLAHLVAVSGAHLVIVCGMTMAAMRRLALPRAAAIVLQVAAILGYLVLTGAPVSAVRAAIMASLSLLSFFSGRRPYALGALSACVIVLLALDPSAAFSTSFALSAASTLGIVLFAGFAEDWIRVLFGFRGDAIAGAAALTVAATAITLPISAAQFNQVSLISPMANIVAGPVFSFLCVAGLAALALHALAPPAGGIALAALLGLGHAFCLSVDAVSRIPFASAPVSLDAGAALLAAAAVPALLWLAWPRPRKARVWAVIPAVAAAAIVAATAPLFHGDEIVMLDVGQGDAILLRSGGHALLVDTGTEDSALMAGLGANGVLRLDAVLITHPDDDHCGSLPALQGVVGVGKVLVARDLLEEDEAHCARLRAAAASLVGGENIVGLSTGDTMACGNLRLSVVGPDAFSDGGGNADSLTLLLEADDDGDGVVDHTALLCGDAEAAQLHGYERLGRLRDIEIYKVGHHGSRAAIDAELVDALRPEVSLVSVGAGNRYGHPAKETLDVLEGSGSAVFRTDVQGSIRCLLEPDRLEVVTER